MRDETRRRVGRLASSLFMVLVAGMAMTSVFLLSYSYLSWSGAFNSDNLLCSALCDDLRHGRDVREWHLPGAPYLFPDVLLLTFCQALTPHVVAEFVAYCFVLHLSLFGVLAWLGQLTGLVRGAALTAAGCGAILLATIHLDPYALGRACLLVHPGGHVGAILIGLLLLALTVRSLRQGLSRTVVAVLVLAGGLGAFSDRLLLSQLLAPLALALIVLAARRVVGVRQAAARLGLLAAVVLLAFGLRFTLRRLGFHLLTVENEFARPTLSDLPLLLRSLYPFVEHEYVLAALVPLHLLVGVTVLWAWFRRSPDPDRIGVLLATLTVVLSPLCTLGAVWIMGVARHPAMGRYVLSCWFLPCLLLPLLMAWLPRGVARMGGALLQLGVVLFAVRQAAVLAPHIDRDKFKRPYPPLAQALDRLARERGPLRGLAGYWLARSTNWCTREDVVINPLLLGEPWFHACNPARFVPDGADDVRAADYQFLIVRPGDPNSPVPAVLALQFGTPAKKIVVGPEEILAVRLAADVAVRSLLAQPLRQATARPTPLRRTRGAGLSVPAQGEPISGQRTWQRRA